MRRTKALESTAYHEAGHAVAAWKLGVRTKKLSIVPDAADGSLGSHQHSPYFTGINLEFDDSPRAQRRVENIAIVCCVGAHSQRRFHPRGFRNYHAEADWHRAISLLSYLAGDNEVLEAYFKLIDLQAKKFVQSQANWCAIEGVAEALLERHALTGAEAKAVIFESIQAATSRPRRRK